MCGCLRSEDQNGLLLDIWVPKGIHFLKCVLYLMYVVECIVARSRMSIVSRAIHGILVGVTPRN